MTSFLSWLLSPENYMPHGMCFLWQPELIALHVASDAAIAVSYYSIPFALAYFVSKRTDLAFPRIFLLTGAFILACGTTHVMSIWTIWFPDYRLDGAIKLITAVVSAATAVALWRTMPFALALPSTAQLEQANRSLASEAAERERAQAALREMNTELERRVAVRTAELQEEVNQRTRSEDALRQSEIYLAEAQRMSRTGSFGWKVGSGEIFWSEETFRIFEIDHVTKPTLELVLQRTHPEDRASLRGFLERASHDGDDLELEHRLLMPDSSVKFVHVVARPANVASGDLEFVGAVMDVTAARRAEEELQRTREELARVSRVTTLGELTAAIAHEVNQPLSGLVSSGNACRRWLEGDSPNLEAARGALDRMVRDGSRAAEVISRIRALVKKSPARKDLLPINDVVDEVLSLTQAELRRNRISLQVDLADDLPLVLGDRVQLQQVMLNLIVNANEALSAVIDGPRELVIRSSKEASNDVAVTVSDTGPGFDGTKLENIFDPFYTTKPEGMGIGLAVSRSIVEAHGGKLWATPNEPRGAVFQLTLPVSGGLSQ